MTDCDHVYQFESIENPTAAQGNNPTRMMWLLCTLCAHRLGRLTQRTDAEIAAEIA